MKTFSTLFLSILLAASVSQAQVEVTSTDNFSTRDQMLLANEINESGEPFAEAQGYDLDLLDPMDLNNPDSIAYTLGIENYEYSRYQLGTVISRYGIKYFPHRIAVLDSRLPIRMILYCRGLTN